MIETRQPVIRCGDRVIGYADLTLDCQEPDCVWIATIMPGSPDDYRMLAAGTEVAIDFFGTIFLLIVDGDGLSRGAGAGASVLGLSIHAVSPLGVKRQPVTKVWPAIDARAAVEELLGCPVVWELEQWTIPAGALAADQADPVQLARQIAGAAGGLLVSRPDGTMVAALKHRARIEDYPRTPPDHILSDWDLSQIQGSREPGTVFNAVTVTDGSVAATVLSVSAVADGDRAAIVRVAVATDPPPAVTLVDAGDGTLTVTDRGLVTRSESELVEVGGGVARLSYPAWSLDGVAWHYRSAGGLWLQSPGTGILAAADAGAATLAQVGYTTRALEWRLTNGRAEDVLVQLVAGTGESATLRVSFTEAGTEAGAAIDSGTTTDSGDTPSSSPGGTATAAEPALSIERDDRSDGANGGKTSFAPGDTVTYLIFGRGARPVRVDASAGAAVLTDPPGPVTRIEDLTFGGTASAQLSIPASGLIDVRWLGASLGSLALGADGVTVTAGWAGTAIARVTYSAAPLATLVLTSPVQLEGDVDFAIALTVLGEAA